MILFGLIHYGPALVAKPHDPGPWTVLFELLAMGGGAWVIAASFPPPPAGLPVTRMADVGRYLIAIALVVFAVQHFMYAEFVASLVTPWIPWHLFWAYFAGVAFAAAALSFVAGRMVRPAATLLGTMRRPPSPCSWSMAGCGDRRPQPTTPVRQSWSRIVGS